MNKSALITATFLTAATVVSARAADLPPRPAPYAAPVVVPVYNWSGFYVGGNLGWAFGNSSATYNPTGLTWEVSKNGFLAGGQAGVNWQTGNFVFGIEGDLVWLNGKSDRTFNGGLSADGGSDWAATIAGRFGVAANNVLWYGKAGAGWVNNTATIYNAAGTTLWTGSNTPVGWLLGAGVEVGLTQNWTTKIEYNYLNLDNWTGTPAILAGDSVSVSRTVQMLKFGVNYKF